MAGRRRRWTDPAALLDHLGIVDPRDIDIRAIGQYCGATIVREPLHGCEARIVAVGDRAIIAVNRTTHPHRWRFSAAHELAHWMLDRHRRAFACTRAVMDQGWNHSGGRRNRNDPELRANRWAADLLMPKHLFAPAVADLPVTLDTARNLTRDFSTSFIATALRLVYLGPYPSMLIWSRPGERFRRFRRSPRMPAAAWPRPEPGPESVAYRLLRGSRERSGTRHVKWSQWLELKDLHWPPAFYLTEDSMRMRNGEVLSLLWFDDEDALDYLHSHQPPHRRGLVGERG